MEPRTENGQRRLGRSGLMVSAIGFGCWPISGVSSLGVTDADSVATIHAALDAGINFFDTAHSYGYGGEADRLLARALQNRSSDAVIASKVGTHYNAHRERIVDGRPATIVAQCEQELQRLKRDSIDLLYLHQPDPCIAIEESAGAIAQLIERGLVHYAGVCNVTLDQLQRFHSTCSIVAVQPPFNMLQQDAVLSIRQYCQRNDISIVCYWVLMKGILAGKMSRNHQFDPRDRRLTYAVYQGQAWQRAQDLLDRLRPLAGELSLSVGQLVVAWTLGQPAITVALCGGKRAEQIVEISRAMREELQPDMLARINNALATYAGGA